MMILDTFCGQGGVSVGLRRVFPNARIVGVDLALQPRYPFEFYEANALWFIEQYGAQFDFIWASPPCQAYSFASAHIQSYNPYPSLVKPTREALKDTGKPYVIENVVGAPLFHTTLLCGTMFNLRVFRHRIFEANFPIPEPVHPSHDGAVGFGKNSYVTVAGHGGHGTFRLSQWRHAMGIDWMNRDGLTQAIPPAYSEYLGRFIPSEGNHDAST